jgi:hypothetical protein
VDPLANFNPFMDDEHYIDGQHNGGVFNHFNHNVYGYCYQNPIILIDPNGKQVVFSEKFISNVLKDKKFSNYSVPVFVVGKILELKSPIVLNCWHAAARQVEYGGLSYYTSTDLNDRVQMAKLPTQKDLEVNVQKGVDLIIKNLEEGKSVVAGVDHGPTDTVNFNVATDHFLNIVGYGKDEKGQYFSYYDNAMEGGEKTGTDTKNNRLYYNEKTNQFEDESGIHGKKIVLTEVRDTKTKEPAKEVELNLSSGICFVKGTKILMEDGTSKSIEDVKVGDYVKTVKMDSMKIKSNMVLKVDSPIHSDLIKINFENGIENVNTFDHPYYVKEKGWCSYTPFLTKERYGLEVRLLESGDECYFYKKDILVNIKIKSIYELNSKVQTYNLTTIEENHNFFANGFLVHNKSLNDIKNDDEKK